MSRASSSPARRGWTLRRWQSSCVDASEWLAPSVRVQEVYAQGPGVVRAAALPLVLADVSGDDVELRLSSALHDEAPELRRAAVRELSRRRLHAPLVDALDDREASIANAALIALGGTQFLDVSTLACLFERPELREQVTSRLAQFPGQSAVELLDRGLRDASAHVRRISAFSLGALGLAKAIAPLRRALESEDDAAVRRAVEVSLRKLDASGDA